MGFDLLVVGRRERHTGGRQALDDTPWREVFPESAFSARFRLGDWPRGPAPPAEPDRSCREPESGRCLIHVAGW